MQGKRVMLFSLLFFATLFLSTFASAQTTSVGKSISDSLNQAATDLGPLVELVLGDVGGAADILFIKLLVFFLILMLVYIAVKQVPQIGENKTAAVLIPVIVSLIAIRFVTSPSLINFIWLPYGVLGVLLSSLLPFFIAFFFIENFESSIIRKVCWAAFGFIFLVLAITRWTELTIAALPGAMWYQNYGMIYLGVALIAGSLVFYDGPIRRWRFKRQIDGIADRRVKIHAISLQEEINELTRKLGLASTDAQRNAVRAELIDKRRALHTLLSE